MEPQNRTSDSNDDYGDGKEEKMVSKWRMFLFKKKLPTSISNQYFQKYRRDKKKWWQ